MTEARNNDLPDVRGIVFTGFPTEDSKVFSLIRARRGAIIGGISGVVYVIDDMIRTTVTPLVAYHVNPLDNLKPEIVVAEVAVVVGCVMAGALIDIYRPTSKFTSAVIRAGLALAFEKIGAGKAMIPEDREALE